MTLKLRGGCWLAVVALLVSSCASFRLGHDTDAHRAPTYEPGVPNFALDAIPYEENGETGIDIALSAPRNTFVFARRDSGYVAPVEIIARLLDRRGRQSIREESWSDTLFAADFEATQTFQRWAWSRSMRATAGRYVLEVTVESAESGGSSHRRQSIEVVDPTLPGPALFGIRMVVRGEGGTAPFVGMHLPVDYDSLWAGVELRKLPADTDVEMRLAYLPSDTTIAVPPYLYSPSGWSLSRIGIAYDRAEVVQRTVRRFEEPVDRLTLLFTLPPLHRGAYEVTIELKSQGEVQHRERREFVVLPAGFPRITTLDQMVEALSYIARRRELEDIRRAPDPVEKRARFDAFWGSLIPNRQEATRVMQSYYSRVEEANVLFSSYKEGWKTDRGMVYIVMGPPVYRQMEPRREIWRYSFGSSMVPDYIFEREISSGLNAAYDLLILKRAPDTEMRWERAVERWRDGVTI